MIDSKVVWIINHYAGSRIHGMEYRHFYLAKYFKQFGFHPAIIASSFHHLFTNPPNAAYERVDGIPYVWVPSCHYKKNDIRRAINMLEFSLRLAFKSPKRLPRPNVIIASSPHLFVAANGYSLSKKYKAKFLFEVRDLWPLTLTEVGGYSACNPFISAMGALERLAYEHCDYTVSLLGAAGNYMVEHGLSGEKFVHIPNGIVPATLNSKTDALPESHSGVIRSLKQEDKLVVLYSGNHGMVNALDNVVEAARILSQDERIHFLLVGQGPEKQKLMATAKDYGLENVTFLRAVRKSQMPALTRMVDVGYIGLQKKDLFRYGVSPNKLFEYMASGLPIVSAIETSNDEVSEAKCGFSIPPENPLALADTLTEMSELSKEQLCNMGKRGQEYVTRTHSYEKLAQKYTKLF